MDYQAELTKLEKQYNDLLARANIVYGRITLCRFLLENAQDLLPERVAEKEALLSAR